MTYTDYLARAELFLGSDRQTAAAQGARSFATAAQAIRFAIEEAAPVSLRGASLHIGEASYDREAIQALYHSPEFPMARKGDIVRSTARRSHQHRHAERVVSVRKVADRRRATA